MEYVAYYSNGYTTKLEAKTLLGAKREAEKIRSHGHNCTIFKKQGEDEFPICKKLGEGQKYSGKWIPYNLED